MADSSLATACAYSVAGEQFGACTSICYSITAGGLFGAAFPLLCSHKVAVDYLTLPAITLEVFMLMQDFVEVTSTKPRKISLVTKEP